MFNNYDFPYTEQFKQEVAESVKKSAKKRRGYFMPVRTGRKIGRNEKCPCGSGKKYKRCCGGE